MKKHPLRSLASALVGLFAFSASAHEAAGPLTDFQKNYSHPYEG